MEITKGEHLHTLITMLEDRGINLSWHRKRLYCLNLGDRYLGELVVAELATEDKEKLSNLREYDEELKILEDWLFNPRIDKYDCLMYASIEMFSDNIGEEKMESQDIELSYNDMILLQQ